MVLASLPQRNLVFIGGEMMKLTRDKTKESVTQKKKNSLLSVRRRQKVEL